jgi:hypothetical protein
MRFNFMFLVFHPMTVAHKNLYGEDYFCGRENYVLRVERLL